MSMTVRENCTARIHHEGFKFYIDNLVH